MSLDEDSLKTKAEVKEDDKIPRLVPHSTQAPPVTHGVHAHVQQSCPATFLHTSPYPPLLISSFRGLGCATSALQQVSVPKKIRTPPIGRERK
ncbi:hypothetical protein EV1_024088 [Malus domestica]